MRKGVIMLMFEKGSSWKGKFYPNFERESEEKLFEKKSEKIEEYVKKIEKFLNE